jgi:hypothetical protein
MSEPVENIAVVTEGLGLLTSMYAKQPNVQAILTAILSVRQTLEAVLWGVYTGRRLPQPSSALYTLPLTNSVLDALGALVGQGRGGLSDVQYQATLLLRVAVNRSSGRITDWSGLAALVLPYASGVEYFEATAAFSLGFWNLMLPALALAGVLADAVPNGVRANFDYSGWAPGNDFEWCAADGTGGQGVWADSTGAVGGLLVASLEMA